MTMAASVILENLPKDAHAALETAGELKDVNGQVKGKGAEFLTHLPLPYYSIAYVKMMMQSKYASLHCRTLGRYAHLFSIAARRSGLNLSCVSCARGCSCRTMRAFFAMSIQFSRRGWMRVLGICGGCAHVLHLVVFLTSTLLTLEQCFKTGDELVVNYSVTQAFG